MLHIEEQQLRSMSIENIVELQKRFNSELERRRRESRDKKIADFKAAYYALKDDGIRITYYEDNYTDPAYLYEWDGFNFD